MNLFADYVQPLTNWLQANPSWALFITFIISLTESLAIIGSIVPGSVTMTAIGILAGSGIMRIDFTLLAAILGAVSGDSLSYALGFFYSERLVEIWPFSKYPNLLKYGKDFFASHGGKSVLIGRFVGPLRSIIPVIAGIMHMKQWRFLIANIISAIGWSILYVMPGVLIGAAGHELSTENATQLFVMILVLLAGVWLASIILKWIFIKIHEFLRKNLHHFWNGLKTTPVFSGLYTLLTPPDEENHYPTAVFCLLILFLLISFLVITVISVHTLWFNVINYPIHIFTQSFHTFLFEAFFISSSQLISTTTITCLYITCVFWFIYDNNLRGIIYLTSIIISSALIAIFFAYLVHIPRPEGLLVTMPGSSYPAINLTIATAFYGFILFYFNNIYSLLTHVLRVSVFIILGLSGFALVYLGDYWFIDILAAYLLGTFICLIHGAFYRKTKLTQNKSDYPLINIIVLFTMILLFTSISIYFNFKTLLHNHTSFHKEFTLTHNEWWNQKTPILPVYRLSRIGKRISILNIQYDGNLELLQKSLEKYGWEHHSETFLTKLIMRMNRTPNSLKLPLLAQLYENKRPELIMTYTVKELNIILELTIWESNYKLSPLNKPLWLGSVHQNIHDKTRQTGKSISLSELINPVSYMIPALGQYNLRRIKVPTTAKIIINTITYPTAPYILLIKSRNMEN